MKSYQQFLAELKRRHVFKVAAIYGVVSFGVLQAADLMLPRLGLPDWTVTFMVALVVLAFPVALILAWAFEVTPEGMQRKDAADIGEIEAIVSAPASQRWPSGLLALLGIAALLAAGWWIGLRTAARGGGTALDGTGPQASALYRDRRFGERTRLWTPAFEPLLDEPLFVEILRKSNLEGRRPRRAAP